MQKRFSVQPFHLLISYGLALFEEVWPAAAECPGAGETANDKSTETSHRSRKNAGSSVVKGAKYTLRAVWLWLYKSNRSGFKKHRAGPTASQSRAAAAENATSLGGGVGRRSVMPEPFIRSLYLKLGILRHHMQHFARRLLYCASTSMVALFP